MKLIRVIISILIPFFLLIFFASLLTTKPYLLLSKGLYENHELIEFDHDYAIDRVIGYLNYRYDDLEFGVDESDDSTTLLSETEIRHMIDVKDLYTTLRISAIVSLIVAVSLSFFLYKRNYNEFYKTFKNIYLGPMFFVLFVGGYLLIEFDKAFNLFHELFFTNEDWLLRWDDVLILMLPTNFWMISAMLILALFTLSFAIIYFINERVFRKRNT